VTAKLALHRLWVERQEIVLEHVDEDGDDLRDVLLRPFLRGDAERDRLAHDLPGFGP
jgi:hypothetical protein